MLDQPNQRIHVDLFGPLKTSERSNKFILCITDAFTKYAEVIPIPDKQAITVANEISLIGFVDLNHPCKSILTGEKSFVTKLLTNCTPC